MVLTQTYEVRKWRHEYDTKACKWEPFYDGAEHYILQEEWEKRILFFFMNGYKMIHQDEVQTTLERTDGTRKFIVTFHREGY